MPLGPKIWDGKSFSCPFFQQKFWIHFHPSKWIHLKRIYSSLGMQGWKKAASLNPPHQWRGPLWINLWICLFCIAQNFIFQKFCMFQQKHTKFISFLFSFHVIVGWSIVGWFFKKRLLMKDDAWVKIFLWKLQKIFIHNSWCQNAWTKKNLEMKGLSSCNVATSFRSFSAKQGAWKWQCIESFFSKQEMETLSLVIGPNMSTGTEIMKQKKNLTLECCRDSQFRAAWKRQTMIASAQKVGFQNGVASGRSL